MRPIFVICVFMITCAGSFTKTGGAGRSYYTEQAVNTLRKQVMEDAAEAMLMEPLTITAYPAAASAGGRHDFFSEGDYFWPNPLSPDSPYLSKDGMTNPGNFTAHRHAMIRLSKIVGALASAYQLTHDKKYVLQALKHCKAWFVNKETMMNPSLLYAQAVRNKLTGRGIGIIDSIHFLEVAQGLLAMADAENADPVSFAAIKRWFETYSRWLMEHEYGIDEMNRANNHGTCWVMQVAAFAKLTGNKKIMQFCSDRFKRVLLPNQFAADGSFPRELRRTKPYGYSLFNMDALATICQLLSTKEDDLWQYTTPAGQTMFKAIHYLAPFIAEKNKWPFPKDIMHWEDWPVAQPSLLFCAKAFDNREWLELWKKLDHHLSGDEVARNLPVRYPLIWMNDL